MGVGPLKAAHTLRSRFLLAWDVPGYGAGARFARGTSSSQLPHQLKGS